MFDESQIKSFYAIEPEDYVIDLECGKKLHTNFYNQMTTIYQKVYGVDVSEKLNLAIDDEINNMENLREPTIPSFSNSDSEKSNEYKNSGGGCLIATATFGSELAPQVQQLRELRDNFLLQTASGTSFMTGFNQFYYSFSPTIADWERENPAFKEMVKITLTPMISSLSILNYVDMDSEVSVLGYGISLILLNVGMYFVAPAIVIFGIKKKL